ncbi:unnamed protein product [Amoebophrya sp. A120]|nr:unnamed protein product [Amoebophrya sp. A120]|eukprot:GSA120T00000592001.1
MFIAKERRFCKPLLEQLGRQRSACGAPAVPGLQAEQMWMRLPSAPRPRGSSLRTARGMNQHQSYGTTRSSTCSRRVVDHASLLTSSARTYSTFLAATRRSSSFPSLDVSSTTSNRLGLAITGIIAATPTTTLPLVPENEPHQQPQKRRSFASASRKDVGDGEGESKRMSETEFHSLADDALNACLDLIEDRNIDEQIEDYDLADGVLKIVVTAKDQIVVNKHNATQQIWYSSPCGAQYFDAPYGELVGALEKDLGELLP